MNHNISKSEVKFMDANDIFCNNHVQSELASGYGDKDEIGITSYLQILPSVGLYGFKFVLPMDGIRAGHDFRVFAARELGLKVPVVQRTSQLYFKGIWLRRFVKLFRIFTGKRYLFRKKWLNPYNKFASKNIVQVCHWQENILSRCFRCGTIKDLPKGTYRYQFIDIICHKCSESEV